MIIDLHFRLIAIRSVVVKGGGGLMGLEEEEEGETMPFGLSLAKKRREGEVSW
jgi:hypothetical protein